MEIYGSGGVHNHTFFTLGPYVGHRQRSNVCVAVPSYLNLWEVVYSICLSIIITISFIGRVSSSLFVSFIVLYSICLSTKVAIGLLGERVERSGLLVIDV